MQGRKVSDPFWDGQVAEESIKLEMTPAFGIGNGYFLLH
jgi:hypothetical protein